METKDKKEKYTIPELKSIYKKYVTSKREKSKRWDMVQQKFILNNLVV
jgi:hypothetical protein